ncbi:hypothetical protein LAY07_01045, partial [Escherichia coli]|nr:hypothetical protein [Escherichia coli]
MFDIYHINRNKDIDASLPANYELDEVKFINSCKTGVSLQFIYLKRRMIMTEIGFAPIFPDTCYHLTHYWPAAADIPVASDNPVHYADAIRYNAR